MKNIKQITFSWKDRKCNRCHQAIPKKQRLIKWDYEGVTYEQRFTHIKCPTKPKP